MKLGSTFILTLTYAFLSAQPAQVQYVESYDLKSQPGAFGLADTVIKAALEGILPTYNFDSSRAEQISADEIRRKLVLFKRPDYPYWDPNSSYVSGDLITHDSYVWEALMDSRGERPERGDYWAKTYGGDVYFLPREISLLQIQFNYTNKTRNNLWIHFVVPAENVPNGSRRYLFSFRYHEFEKFINQTSFAFYQFNSSGIGWVNDGIFSFEDSYYQGKLKSELCRFAHQNKKDCKIYFSLDSLFTYFKIENPEVMDPFNEENYTYRTGLEFRWQKKSVDTIRIYYNPDSFGQSYRKVADVPFRKFIFKFKGDRESKFKGFHSFSSAIATGILAPLRTDTLLRIAKGKDYAGASNNTKNPITTLTTIQRFQYTMKISPNSRLLKVGDEFGKYIFKAIVSGKFKTDFKAFSNDSLKSQVSEEEIQRRMIVQRAPTYPPWDVGASYYNQDIVEFNGQYYECILDHINKNPTTSTDQWRPIEVNDFLFGPLDFKMFYISYQLEFNPKCQLMKRYPVAITIYVFDDITGTYKSIMTLDIQTLKNILEDSSVGNSGTLYWNLIERGELSGFYRDNTPIRKLY